MSSFLVLEIYLLIFFIDGERAGWNRFLHAGSIEDEGDNYINILTGIDDMETFISGWQHQGGDSVTVME